MVCLDWKSVSRVERGDASLRRSSLSFARWDNLEHGVMFS